MKRTILMAALVAGCSGGNLDSSRGPNGEGIVGNRVSVQITNASSPTAAFSLAEEYCRKDKRSARFVARTAATDSFDCVKAS